MGGLPSHRQGHVQQPEREGWQTQHRRGGDDQDAGPPGVARSLGSRAGEAGGGPALLPEIPWLPEGHPGLLHGVVLQGASDQDGEGQGGLEDAPAAVGRPGSEGEEGRVPGRQLHHS